MTREIILQKRFEKIQIEDVFEPEANTNRIYKHLIKSNVIPFATKIEHFYCEELEINTIIFTPYREIPFNELSKIILEKNFGKINEIETFKKHLNILNDEEIILQSLNLFFTLENIRVIYYEAEKFLKKNINYLEFYDGKDHLEELDKDKYTLANLGITSLESLLSKCGEITSFFINLRYSLSHSLNSLNKRYNIEFSLRSANNGINVFTENPNLLKVSPLLFELEDWKILIGQYIQNKVDTKGFKHFTYIKTNIIETLKLLENQFLQIGETKVIHPLNWFYFDNNEINGVKIKTIDKKDFNVPLLDFIEYIERLNYVAPKPDFCLVINSKYSVKDILKFFYFFQKTINKSIYADYFINNYTDLEKNLIKPHYDISVQYLEEIDDIIDFFSYLKENGVLVPSKNSSRKIAEIIYQFYKPNIKPETIRKKLDNPKSSLAKEIRQGLNYFKI